MRSESKKAGQSDRTFTEEARRAQIVDCAIATIAELGYGRASLAEIAKRAGISKGVISYHFTGKDELIERVVEYIYTSAAEDMVPRLSREPTAAEFLRTYITANVEFIRDHPREIAVVADIVVNYRTPEGALHYGVHTDGPMLKPLIDMFEAGQRDGEFRSFGPEPMARVLRAAIDSTSAQVVAFPNFDADAYARELVTLFDLGTRKDTA